MSSQRPPPPQGPPGQPPVRPRIPGPADQPRGPPQAMQGPRPAQARGPPQGQPQGQPRGPPQAYGQGPPRGPPQFPGPVPPRPPGLGPGQPPSGPPQRQQQRPAPPGQPLQQRPEGPGQPPIQPRQPAPSPPVGAVRPTGAVPKQPQAGGRVSPKTTTELPIGVFARMGVSADARSRGSRGRSSGSSGESTGSGRATEKDTSRKLFVTRNPNFDKVGKDDSMRVVLLANYFPVTQAQGTWIIRQYRVDFEPEVDDTRVKRRLYNLAKQGLPNAIFDGTQLWTSNDLGQAPITKVVKEGDQVFHVKIRFTRELTGDDEAFSVFLNNVLHTLMRKLSLVEMPGKADKEFYDEKEKVRLPNSKLELWPGYKTVLRNHDLGPLLNCDVGFKVLNVETVHAVIQGIVRRGGDARVNVEKALLGRQVITHYNNRVYRIDEIEWDYNPVTYKFPWWKAKDQLVSLSEYMMAAKNLKVQDLRQILIVSKPTRSDLLKGQTSPHVLIPEFCLLTGLSAEERGNFKLMQGFKQATQFDPPSRVNALLKFSERLFKTPDFQTELASWGLQIERTLLKIEARQFRPEAITFGGGARPLDYKSENAEWGKGLRSKMYIPPKECRRWVVIYFDTDSVLVQAFVKECQAVARQMGFVLDNPTTRPLKESKPGAYVSENQKAIKEEAPQLIMTCVPNNKGEVYHSVKRLCYVDYPTPSQVMTMTVLNKNRDKLNPIALKVVTQMATKLGGEPWKVDTLKGLMVAGYDCWHDTTRPNASAGAVVCTINESQSRFHSTGIIHTTKEELCAKLGNALKNGLDAYKKVHGYQPKGVVFYRDGIGEGDIQRTHDMEASALKAVVNQHAPGTRFAFVIVSKRINAKFMLSGPGNKVANPNAGTVVDTRVTLPERYDFFLVSHSSRQGTINPTSYNVIMDDTKLPAATMQKLTYKQCHLYYNWPGTVRVPAVCQYAHKLAYIIGESLHVEPSQRMAEQLYYL